VLNYGGFIRIGAAYADAVITPQENKKSEKINKLLQDVSKLKNAELIDNDGDMANSYYNLYNALLN
jgi:hypothetical protein